jgi:hypothetical protein
VPVIFFTFSKFQFIVIIAVDVIKLKATLCNTDLDISQSYQLQASAMKWTAENTPNFTWEASWSSPPSVIATFFQMN